MKRVGGLSGEALGRAYKLRRIRQISAMLFVYAIFYICRLAFSASKKDMIEQGAYTAKEIGVVGSAMLIAYGIGKFIFALEGWWLNSIVILAMLPAALNDYILSQRYHSDEEFASVSVLLSTLLFSITITVYSLMIKL